MTPTNAASAKYSDSQRAVYEFVYLRACEKVDAAPMDDEINSAYRKAYRDYMIVFGWM